MDWEDSDLDGVSVDASEWDWEESDWSGDERIDDVERIDDNEEMMSDEEGGGAWPGCREEKQVSPIAESWPEFYEQAQVAGVFLPGAPVRKVVRPRIRAVSPPLPGPARPRAAQRKSVSFGENIVHEIEYPLLGDFWYSPQDEMEKPGESGVS